MFDMAHSLGAGTMFLGSCIDIIVIGDAIRDAEIQAIAIRQRTARRDTNKLLACLACRGFLIPR